MDKKDQKGEIVIYKTEDGQTAVDVRLQDETVWLTQKQIAALFGTQRPAITKHLRNIFNSKELREGSVSSILEHTARDGKIYRTKFYHQSHRRSMIKDSQGNAALLNLPKTAFLCSRRCPPQVVLKSYDWAIGKRNAKTCVLSGNHSQIEKDVLHYLLKGEQAIIVALARGLKKRLAPELAEALTKNRLLILMQSGSAPNIHDNDLYTNEFGLFLEQGQPSNLKWNNFGYICGGGQTTTLALV